MKVCFLIYNLEPGGLQNFLFRFLAHYKEKIEATIIVKNGQDGHFFNRFMSIGVNVQLIKSGYFNIKGWYKIYFFFKINKFDSVCDLTGNFGGIYLLLAKWLRVRKRVAFFGQSNNHFQSNPQREIYNFLVNRLVDKNATCIIANSKTGMDYFFPLKNKSDGRFKIIANGINSNEFSCGHDNSIRHALNIPDNAFVVGNTGRFDEKKNHNAILQLAKLSIERKDSFFYIIGGYGTECLIPIIKEMNLSEKVYVLGYRQDIPILLKNFDAFYFPSFTEGLSNSILEALLSGLPIIASNITSNKEALPLVLWQFLTEPNDFDKAYHNLAEISKGYHHLDPFELRKWAISNFNHEKLFKGFLDCL